MAPQLAGKVALITGSGRNIGRAIALRFAGEGADVVVNSGSEAGEAEAVAAEVRSLGRRALAVVADVADRERVEHMVQSARDTFGRIDMRVHAAAIRPHMPFLDLTLDDWNRVRSVILDGAINCTQTVLSAMLEQGGGSVVFIVGEGAWRGGEERGHIGAAKMALVGLCRGLATEFGPRGIRINAVSPGRIDTGDQAADPAGIPLGRLGEPDDVASACLFLVSDHSSWITGQTLHVNGGEWYH